MSGGAADKPKQTAISPQQVKEFLLAHPHFLKEHPDLAAAMAAPKRELNEGIVDFQQYLVTNLQKGSRELQDRYDGLVDFCRDNMSAQSQVHHAALRLMQARSIEQLLEVMTLDLAALFNVDVARLAMESDMLYETAFGEQNYSGIVFIPPGTLDMAMGERRGVQLVGDCATNPPPGFFDIFADCDDMIASCAFLRLATESIDQPMALAFGVRHKERFHAGQGVELLHFLGQVAALQLDRYLHELAV